jgi:membrane protein
MDRSSEMANLEVRIAKVDVVALLKDTFAAWAEDKASRLGAAVAYYTIFSMAPLLIVVISVAGLAFGAQAVRGEIAGQLTGLVGTDGAAMVQTMIANASKPSDGIIASVIGVVTLLLGATGLFGELQDALNTIWEIAPKPRGILLMIREKFLSFGMVLGIAFLLLVALVVSSGLAAMGQFMNGLLPVPEIVLQAVDFVLSFGIVTLLFAAMFKVLPDAVVAWHDVLIGAMVTSLLFAIGKLLIGLYLGHSGTASTYGAAGSLVVLLLWIYYSAQILFFGAEFTQLYANRYGGHIRPSAKATALADQARPKNDRPDAEPNSATGSTTGKAAPEPRAGEARELSPVTSFRGGQKGQIIDRPFADAGRHLPRIAFAVALAFGVSIGVARALRARAAISPG